MKKVLDKLLNTVKFDKKYILFCLIIVLIGIISGSLFIVILKSSDKILVVEYIESFINSIKINSLNSIDILKNSIVTNLIVISIITILGLTYVLSSLNILIIFYKSFVIGFSISSFILTYKIKGLILSIIYIFPHLIINILLFSILTAFTLKLSFKMVNHIIKKKQVDMRLYLTKYVYTVLLIVFLIILTGLYEAFISTALLKLIVNTL